MSPNAFCKFTFKKHTYKVSWWKRAGPFAEHRCRAGQKQAHSCEQMRRRAASCVATYQSLYCFPHEQLQTSFGPAPQRLGL